MITTLMAEEVKFMYGGNSGCYGMILYNTDIKGKNAVYGYYKGDNICLETGTLEEMKALKNSQDKDVPRASNTAKSLVIMFFAYLAAVVIGFVVFPLKPAFALLVFCIGTYFPLLIIINARTGLYKDPVLKDQFRRYHGCEHATMNLLTKKKPAEMESFCDLQIYDTECGTAYSGYAVTLVTELALLIIFWPGILKAAGLLLLTAILLLVMILVPRMNPFTMLQRPVVLPPGEKECLLAIEIMKKLRELE